MAASPAAMDTGTGPVQEKWNAADDHAHENIAPSVDADANGGPSSDSAVPPAHDNTDYAPAGSGAGSGAPNGDPSAEDDTYRGEKQVKVLIRSLSSCLLVSCELFSHKQHFTSRSMLVPPTLFLALSAPLWRYCVVVR